MIDDLCDLLRRVVFFPVRHHSPGCARRVVELARRMRPDALLIEGPSDFKDRFAELYLPHTLPIAIYSFVRLADQRRRGAYHPFCIYSPEWQALTVAKELGAAARFIDMPWADIARIDEVANRYADRGMRRNAIQLAERKAALGRAPAYLYLLTFESVPFGGRYGSVHGTEMPLFYHNLDRWPIAGTGPAAQALAGQMAGAYIAFAKTGVPTVPGIGDWPAYTPARRATMVFDARTRVEDGPDRALLDLNERHSVAPQPPRN